MTLGMQQRLLQGYWPLTVPLGYTNLNKGQKADKHKIVVDEKGKILRQAWTWKLKYGYPNNEIVKRLNKAGLKITERKLSATFRNPFYCGRIVCSFIQGSVVQGKHEAMVSEKEWVNVIDILTNRFRKSKHSTEISEQLPLKRFMTCGECGEPYTGYLQKQKNLFYYRCRSKGCCNNRSRKKLHLEFGSFLNQFEVNASSTDHIAKVMRYVFLQHNQGIAEEVESYKKNLSKLDQKMEQLEERFIEGEVNKDLYDKYSAKFLQERNEVMLQIEKSSIESSNLENCIDWVVSMSQNLSNIWGSGTYEEQLSLQEMIFPEGIAYDRENGAFLTNRINCLFLPIPQITKVSAHKKNRIEGEKFLRSG